MHTKAKMDKYFFAQYLPESRNNEKKCNVSPFCIPEGRKRGLLITTKQSILGRVSGAHIMFETHVYQYIAIRVIKTNRFG